MFEAEDAAEAEKAERIRALVAAFPGGGEGVIQSTST